MMPKPKTKIVTCCFATGFWSRAKGLLWAKADFSPLFFAHCRCVHTFGMRRPIGLVWLTSQNTVVHLDPYVHPWSIRVCIQANNVLEYNPSDATFAQLKIGDVLHLKPST